MLDDHLRTVAPSTANAIEQIEALLQGEYRISKRLIASLLVQHDSDLERRIAATESEQTCSEISRIIAELHAQSTESTVLTLARARQQAATAITRQVMTQSGGAHKNIAASLGRACMHPVWGVPILLAVLYFGLYRFVGLFGGGTLVGWLEDGLFGQYINPAVQHAAEAYIPWAWLRDLFIGDFGIMTLGITYAFALILPIVSTFFLVFSILEDSGYLPRLAMLIDQHFKRIGLNGRAVIPLVLGFGCDTMATMVTRILETRRERVIATFLLALAVPCSAQLGVIMALLSPHPRALIIWTMTLVTIFLVNGWLAARVVPGAPATFHMEIPTMRWPSLANVLAKTLSRVWWYLIEVLPLFVLASVLIWLGKLAGLFQILVAWLAPVARSLGLPDAAAEVLLFGFFRRDYGAAGLYRLHQSDGLDPVQLLVASVTLTLFLPCVAQAMMMMRERGWRTTLGIAAVIIPVAYSTGWLINTLVRLLRVPI